MKTARCYPWRSATTLLSRISLWMGVKRRFMLRRLGINNNMQSRGHCQRPIFLSARYISGELFTFLPLYIIQVQNQHLTSLSRKWILQVNGIIYIALLIKLRFVLLPVYCRLNFQLVFGAICEFMLRNAVIEINIDPTPEWELRALSMLFSDKSIIIAGHYAPSTSMFWL